MTTPTPPTNQRIIEAALGFQVAQVLLTAVDLDVFTGLAAAGPLDLEALRRRAGIQPRGARDFFDALVALGFLDRDAAGRYANTPDVDYYLDAAKPSYIGGFLRMVRERLCPMFGALGEGLRTGRPQNEARDATGGDPFPDMFADPQAMERFLAAMTGLSIPSARAIAARFPWDRYRTFADVGAAQGGCAVELALAHPHLSGVGFDLPQVQPVFEAYVARFGLGERLRFQAGSFFQNPLPRADVLVMGHILHDWNLDEKRLLLRKAYEALPPGGALVVYDAIIDDERRRFVPGLLISLTMLLETPGGFDYTGADGRQWMREAGSATRPSSRSPAPIRCWSASSPIEAARADAVGGAAMRATRPPDERRARHEAAGEWPQPSLSALLDARVRATPDAMYVIEGARDGGRAWTFRDLARRADRMAVALGRAGLRAGDVVSWQLPNWFESAALAVALDRIGAVSNPIITIYREREVEFVCRQAGARALVVPGVVRGVDHRELADAVRRRVPSLEHVFTVRAAPAAGQRALEALEDDPPGPLPPSPLGPHDVSMLFYTSGTTADPKGVLHTPSTLGATLAGQAKLFPPDPTTRSLISFPLMHIGGILMFVQQQILHGSSTVFMEQFDPELCVELIERHGVTSAGGPPAVLQALFAARNFSPERMRSVRTSGSGAADVSPELMRRAQERLGAFVYRSYGMTECPVFSCGRRDDPEAKRHGTDGRPSPGCVARIVDDRGEPVAPGTEGEIEVYGPQLCVGYLDPALNEAFTADGFFRTGDLAIADAEGHVRITGRRKDVIIRKGENLSAKGIEDDLATHPSIQDVAVIGVPDPESGERVCACVVQRPGTPPLTLEDVRAHMIARHVMRQKIPERLELLDELPRNATGKVKKDVLRARYGR